VVQRVHGIDPVDKAVIIGRNSSHPPIFFTVNVVACGFHAARTTRSFTVLLVDAVAV
jgi:hypothetical protein